MDPTQIIACLNAIGVGEMDLVRTRLGEAREACRRIDQPQLAEKLDEAGLALDSADLKTYRKRVESVISRLGHLK